MAGVIVTTAEHAGSRTCPVMTIALHGALAATTIALVLLAVPSVG
jgi:hypothetical protein